MQLCLDVLYMFSFYIWSYVHVFLCIWLHNDIKSCHIFKPSKYPSGFHRVSIVVTVFQESLPGNARLQALRWREYRKKRVCCSRNPKKTSLRWFGAKKKSDWGCDLAFDFPCIIVSMICLGRGRSNAKQDTFCRRSRGYIGRTSHVLKH